MSRSIILIGVCLVVGSFFVYFGVACPDWILNPEDDPSENQNLTEYKRVFERLQKRESIIDDLLAERISPRCCLVQLEQLNQENHYLDEYFERHYPKNPHWERTALQLLLYLEVYFQDDPKEFDSWQLKLLAIAKELDNENPPDLQSKAPHSMDRP
jgi:hypothetical protein